MNVSGATLENKAGDLFLTARTAGELNPNTNVLIAGLVSGGDANSTSSMTVHNEIDVENALLEAANVNVVAGRDSAGVYSQAEIRRITCWGSIVRVEDNVR